MNHSDLFEKLNEYAKDAYKVRDAGDNVIINDTDIYLQKSDDSIYSISSIQKNSLSNYSTNFKKLTNVELDTIKNEIKTNGHMSVKASQESSTFTPTSTIIVDIVEYTNKNDETNIYFLDSSNRFWKYVSIS